MPVEDRWLLPEGIEELLPTEARRLEHWRRNLLDLYHSWGYELVIPPLIEFLDSLLTGTGNDLDIQTFKLTDQLSGRMMGVRADMTPQVARIDAHHLQRNVPTRLCYMGTVLQTRGDRFGGSRSPFQVGAELYGHAGLASDLEVVSLMLETLNVVGLTEVHLDLGHVAIFRHLLRQAGLAPEQEDVLFNALRRKARPEIEILLQDYRPAAAVGDMLMALVELNGGEEVLEVAERVLAAAGDEVRNALDSLHQLAAAVRRWVPDLPIHFDIAELEGYRYHTGVVFAAYVAGRGQAIAKGGRYDEIGQVFGRARPATGFSTDLRSLLTLLQPKPEKFPGGIYAPVADDARLDVLIRELRSGGERVIRGLPGSETDPWLLGCDRKLVKQNEDWVITSAMEDNRDFSNPLRE